MTKDDDIRKRLDVIIRLMLEEQIKEGKMKREEQLILMDSVGLSSGDIGKIMNQESKNISSQINKAKKKNTKSERGDNNGF